MSKWKERKVDALGNSVGEAISAANRDLKEAYGNRQKDGEPYTDPILHITEGYNHDDLVGVWDLVLFPQQ